MKRNRLAAYAVGIAVVMTMAGCGGDDEGGSSDFADEPAADIVDEASKAMRELESLTIAGEMTSAEQTATIDVQLSNTGDCTGTLSFDTTGEIQILGVEGDVWFQGDEAFWTSSGAPDPSLFVGKWVPDDDGSFAEFCSVEDFVSGLFDDETEEDFKTTGTDTVDGEDVVVIEQTDSEDGVSTGYIRTDSPHYMVKIEKEGDEGGSVTFANFDEEFDVTAPSADEIIDPALLG